MVRLGPSAPIGWFLVLTLLRGSDLLIRSLQQSLDLLTALETVPGYPCNLDPIHCLQTEIHQFGHIAYGIIDGH